MLFEVISEVGIDPITNVIQPLDQQDDSAIKLRKTSPLTVPLLGFSVNSFNPLIAGLLMIASSIFVGWRVTVSVVPGMAVILGGRLWNLPELFSLQYFDLTSIAVGVVLLVGGVLTERFVR